MVNWANRSKPDATKIFSFELSEKYYLHLNHAIPSKEPAKLIISASTVAFAAAIASLKLPAPHV